MVPECYLIIAYEITFEKQIKIEMKTAKEMVDERLTIQDGYLKGARITISESLAIELMEDYHSQFSQEIELLCEKESNIFDSLNADSSKLAWLHLSDIVM